MYGLKPLQQTAVHHLEAYSAVLSFCGFWAAVYMFFIFSEPQQALRSTVVWAVVPQFGCLYHVIHQNGLIVFTKTVEAFFSAVKTEGRKPGTVPL